MTELLKLGDTKGQHSCMATEQGDWIIFKCPLCPQYERRINKVTGEMKSKHHKNDFIRHYGTFARPGFDIPFPSNN